MELKHAKNSILFTFAFIFCTLAFPSSALGADATFVNTEFQNPTQNTITFTSDGDYGFCVFETNDPSEDPLNCTLNPTPAEYSISYPMLMSGIYYFVFEVDSNYSFWESACMSSYADCLATNSMTLPDYERNGVLMIDYYNYIMAIAGGIFALFAPLLFIMYFTTWIIRLLRIT